MNRFFLYSLVLITTLFFSCRNDESHNVVEPTPAEPGSINLDVTGRIGTKIGENLTSYVKSLNLMLFRQNASGDYLFVRNVDFTKEGLESLGTGRRADAGFTLPKIVTFDSLPLGNYKIVGVGNITDSLGGKLGNAALVNMTPGQAISAILATVKDGEMAPRLFWGITDVIPLGGALPAQPVLRLYRKVAMFALTVKAIPPVVSQISMDISNLSGSFNMSGDFTAGRGNFALSIKPYVVQPGDSVVLTYITLPSVSEMESEFIITFYLENSTKQVIQLPSYLLKANTITRLTATIDVDQPGGQWKADATFTITADVEWNVDQEPPITI